ncbi:hypothetical protein [Thermogemmatispora sp.]|uniref:hypothetical protein n=1 Tax=Thermogemmatispora sp. TaxID=1968838 RepID=UPI0035E417F6
MHQDMAQDHATAQGGPPLPPLRAGTVRLSHTVPRLLVEDQITLPFNIELTWRQSGLLLLGLSLALSWWHALSWLGEDPLGVMARLVLAGMPLIGGGLVGWLHPLGRPLEQWFLVLWRFWRQPRCLAWSPHPAWRRLAEQLLESTDEPPSQGQEERRWDE